MCGRINVVNDPIIVWIEHRLGLKMVLETNPDLRPTEQVSVIIQQMGGFVQKNLSWGIRPDWSKRLIINAKGETVATKVTFKQAFANHRCVVPCTGWYEWRDEGGKRKQKYLFESADEIPCLMAGIWYPGESNQLVTLTTSPNEVCGVIHDRMPALIRAKDIEQWLGGSGEQAQALLAPIENECIKISKVNS